MLSVWISFVEAHGSNQISTSWSEGQSFLRSWESASHCTHTRARARTHTHARACFQTCWGLSIDYCLSQLYFCIVNVTAPHKLYISNKTFINIRVFSLLAVRVTSELIGTLVVIEMTWKKCANQPEFTVSVMKPVYIIISETWFAKFISFTSHVFTSQVPTCFTTCVRTFSEIKILSNYMIYRI